MGTDAFRPEAAVRDGYFSKFGDLASLITH
jgi:hypothetical protein